MAVVAWLNPLHLALGDGGRTVSTSLGDKASVAVAAVHILRLLHGQEHAWPHIGRGVRPGVVIWMVRRSLAGGSIRRSHVRRIRTATRPWRLRWSFDQSSHEEKDG